jgi:hypothetical protein
MGEAGGLAVFKNVAGVSSPELDDSRDHWARFHVPVPSFPVARIVPGLWTA